MKKIQKITMKSTQLLSVVFSLIMFTSVTAGNAAFAESDDIDDILEDFCDMTLHEQSDVLSEYDLDDYAEKLAAICEIKDEDDREDSLEDVIDAMDLDTHDDNDRDETYDDINETDDDFDLDDLLDNYCEMTDEQQRQLLADHPRLALFHDRLANYCDLSEDEQDTIYELIEEHGDKIRHELREDDDERHMNPDVEMKKHLTRYCEMIDSDKMAFVEENDKTEDHIEKMNRYCEMDEDGRMDFIEEHRDEYVAHMKNKMNDKKHHMDYKKDMRAHLEKYCEMSDEDKKAFVAEHDKAEDHVEKMSRYCSLDEDGRMDFIEEHKDEYKAHMKDKMHDKVTDKKHMDYDRLCAMTKLDRAAEIDDSEKLERLSNWCEMTPEEREDYKKEHHDGVMDEKKHEMTMKLSDKSNSLKEMIMDKHHELSDEKREEIKMKYIEKHGELTDEKKSELKSKFEVHMKTIKHKISDERKSEIHDRLAEMKAFKAELREKSSDLTDEEKQQLGEEFIEKAKDLRLAWISPRIQMTAGVDSAEVECREGFSLVMKTSNGVAMCLKADSALKMIDRGIVVPAI